MLLCLRSVFGMLLFICLLCYPQFSQATHNIFAYRFSDERGVVHHDCDDDGETAAGTRLAEMMRLMGVSGVALVVSRWYGGCNLGPDRFKYICNSARNLLESYHFVDRTASSQGIHKSEAITAGSRRPHKK
jgi:putative IMPACT (imprinted ancient) family translation regulator